MLIWQKREAANFMENWKNIKNLIEYPASGILSKEIFKTEKVEISLFCMPANSNISEHTATREGMVYMLEGGGAFILDGKEIKITEGVMIHMNSNEIHSIKASANTAFLLFLFN